MKVFTVSQINRIIKDLIDNEVLLEDVTISGELSSFSITRGIAYFTIKDADNLLSCVQFGAKQTFNIGDMIECRGNIKYYPKGGKLSLNVYEIKFSGQGELYKQFLELKEKLNKEGLFDKTNKVPLPRFINSVGVVTSSTGAVLQDIKNVTSRRNPNLDIYVYDAQVQGNYAVQQVIEGVTYFDNYSDVDVIIVARGGGSIEDLAPFNNEELARVAYICNKPLISAVGHETDFSILDFVADLRAPTPSAAAELVTYDVNELKTYINNLNWTISSNVDNAYNELNNRLKTITLNIENEINDIVNDNKLSVINYYNQIKTLTESTYQTSTHNVDKIINILDKLSPLRILKSGYSYVLNEENQPITSTNTKVGDVVNIITENTKYNAKITKKEKFNVREKH